MKPSKKLQDLLNSISIEDITEAWNQKPTTPLDIYLTRLLQSDLQAIDNKEPWVVLDNQINIWKLYIPVFEKADKHQGEYLDLWCSAWAIRSRLPDILYYHPDLPYLSAMVHYYLHRPHTPEILNKILDCVVAVRYCKPFPLTTEEKEIYKNEYVKFCKENDLPETLKEHFGDESDQSRDRLSKRRGFPQ